MRRHMQAYIHRHAPFEDDTLGNVQPVKVVVENATKTAIQFPCAVMTREAAFKTRRSLSGGAEIAGVDNARVENDGGNCRVGHCRSGQ